MMSSLHVARAKKYLIVLFMITISTYNCQSSKRNVGGINMLCNNSDIVFLQEHWLFPSDLPSLNNIHPDFISFGLSSMDPFTRLISGRPYGGVAVLWRKALTHLVKPVTYDADRILGLEVYQGETKLLLLGVYLPYCTPPNFESYVYYLGKIKAIVDESDSPYVCVLGDFNADIVKATEFGKELESFCVELNPILLLRMHYISVLTQRLMLMMAMVRRPGLTISFVRKPFSKSLKTSA